MQSFTSEEEDLLEPTPLQFDLEAVDLWPCAAVVRQPHTATAAVRQQLRDLLVPECECEAVHQLRELVRSACREAERQQGAVTPEELSALLRALGYSAKVAGPPRSPSRVSWGGRQSFVTVCLPDTGSRYGLSSVVVDANFREQFAVAKPSARYASVLSALDPEAVAPLEALQHAVAMLARELARSFAEQGLALPPWRSQAVLQGKWGAGTHLCGVVQRPEVA